MHILHAWNANAAGYGVRRAVIRAVCCMCARAWGACAVVACASVAGASYHVGFLWELQYGVQLGSRLHFWYLVISCLFQLLLVHKRSVIHSVGNRAGGLTVITSSVQTVRNVCDLHCLVQPHARFCWR